MKFGKSFLFYILLAVLFLSNLGFSEGLENRGIPKNKIPRSDEDLYILKSTIVPPVCPKCPDINVCPKVNNKCPPCPPCGRCPEPAFKCKKVPNYKSKNAGYLPQPVLTDFSQFSA